MEGLALTQDTAQERKQRGTKRKVKVRTSRRHQGVGGSDTTVSKRQQGSAFWGRRYLGSANSRAEGADTSARALWPAAATKKRSNKRTNANNQAWCCPQGRAITMPRAPEARAALR